MLMLSQRVFIPTVRHSLPHPLPSVLANGCRRHIHKPTGVGQKKDRVSLDTLDLAYETYAPPNREPGGPLIILHGLFGSKQNWRSLSKLLGNSLRRQVYALDLRNHGTSPHHPNMTYTTMANDVIQFLYKHHIVRDVTLLGHSMGGKVAMSVALSPLLEKYVPGALTRLISVDMTPATGKVSDEFKNYVEAMQAVEDAKVKSKKEADAILDLYEKDVSIRQFLLTNLLPDKHGSHFRIPLSHLREAVSQIGDFPYPADGTHHWDGRALFVKGAKSKYVNRHNIPLIKEYFPGAELEVLEAGHWVHSEKPKEFVDLVVNWIKQDAEPPKEKADGTNVEESVKVEESAEADAKA